MRDRKKSSRAPNCLAGFLVLAVGVLLVSATYFLLTGHDVHSFKEGQSLHHHMKSKYKQKRKHNTAVVDVGVPSPASNLDNLDDGDHKQQSQPPGEQQQQQTQQQQEEQEKEAPKPKRTPEASAEYTQCLMASDPDHTYFDTARFNTTKGVFNMQLRPELAPHGVQHLRSLIEGGYYNNGTVSFQQINRFTVMFGANEIQPAWREKREYPNALNTQKDDNPCEPGKRWERGLVAMMGGPHVMIIKTANDYMGKNENDAPSAYITEGDMKIVDKLYEYESELQMEVGQRQERILASGGDAYLKRDFPELDYILHAEIV